VELTKEDLRRALDVREGIHALLKANNGAKLDVEAVRRLDTAAVGARIEVRFESDGSVRFVAASSSFADVLGSLLGMVATARLHEDWRRFKACADRECRAAFWAPQMKGKWCSHRCGDRVRGKMRRGAIGTG
jgi:hypothetical protein